MSERKAFVKKVLSVAALLFIYYIFVNITGFSIPCVFHKVTGLKCPSCGITSMAMHLSRLELSEAFDCNVLLFFMLPFFMLLILIKIAFMPKWLTSKSRVFGGILWVCIVLLIAYGILRNLSFFPIR